MASQQLMEEAISSMEASLPAHLCADVYSKRVEIDQYKAQQLAKAAAFRPHATTSPTYALDVLLYEQAVSSVAVSVANYESSLWQANSQLYEVHVRLQELERLRGEMSRKGQQAGQYPQLKREREQREREQREREQREQLLREGEQRERGEREREQRDQLLLLQEQLQQREEQLQREQLQQEQQQQWEELQRQQQQQRELLQLQQQHELQLRQTPTPAPALQQLHASAPPPGVQLSVHMGGTLSPLSAAANTLAAYSSPALPPVTPPPGGIYGEGSRLDASQQSQQAPSWQAHTQQLEQLRSSYFTSYMGLHGVEDSRSELSGASESTFASASTLQSAGSMHGAGLYGDMHLHHHQQHQQQAPPRQLGAPSPVPHTLAAVPENGQAAADDRCAAPASVDADWSLKTVDAANLDMLADAEKVLALYKSLDPSSREQLTQLLSESLRIKSMSVQQPPAGLESKKAGMLSAPVATAAAAPLSRHQPPPVDPLNLDALRRETAKLESLVTQNGGVANDNSKGHTNANSKGHTNDNSNGLGGGQGVSSNAPPRVAVGEREAMNGKLPPTKGAPAAAPKAMQCVDSNTSASSGTPSSRSGSSRPTGPKKNRSIGKKLLNGVKAFWELSDAMWDDSIHSHNTRG